MLFDKDGKVIRANLDDYGKCETLADVEEMLNVLESTKGISSDEFAVLLFQRSAIDKFIANCLMDETLRLQTDMLIGNLNNHDLNSVLDVVKNNKQLVTTMIAVSGCFEKHSNTWLYYLRSKALATEDNKILLNNIMDLVYDVFPALDFDFDMPDISYIPYQLYKDSNNAALLEFLPSCSNDLNEIVKAYYSKDNAYSLDQIISDMAAEASRDMTDLEEDMER